MDEWSIGELQDKMDSGEWTARAATEMYLERIQRLDREGPALHSVIEINPDALDIADGLDAERRAKGPRGPLHGIPVLIKDNIDTADRMHTTAGSLALVGRPAPRDAFLVRRLRDAGAVLLGKTNLSEWANFRSTHSSSGWSSRGGQTKHPYALDRNPCGSSTGSAVAVAANLCTVAVGTETDGSIVCPSHANSIVGIKPTLGLVSRSGIVPIAHSQDTAGPMARTVRDAAVLLGVLAGIDQDDPKTEESRGKAASDYISFLDPKGLAGTRIGVARNFFGFDARVDAIMDTCIETIKRLGAEVVDPANVETPKELDEAELTVLHYEFKADLNAYLAGRGAGSPVHSLSDVIEFNDKHAREVMPFFGQELMIEAEKKGPLTDEEYIRALETCRRLARLEGIDATLAKHRLDAIIAPTGGVAWLTDWVKGDYGAGGSSTPAAVAGYPSITVPAGYIFGLPVGLSFIGGAFQEPALIRFAYAFEQAGPVRRPPQFLATAISPRT